MFTFLKRLFGGAREENIDLELEIEESWQTDFRKHGDARFVAETGDSYESLLTDRGFALRLTKKNVYAWSVNPLYRYRDFVIEGLIEFPRPTDAIPLAADALGTAIPGNAIPNTAIPSDAQIRLNDGTMPARAGTMAAGFLFRYLSDGTFYSVLVSDGGMVRMDVVINGTPVPILGWTETTRAAAETPEIPVDDSLAPYRLDDRVFSLRIVARGTGFTIIVNDSWVAECADDTIQAAGKVAFAAQRWDGHSADQAILSGIAIDSDPIEVEAVYARWNQFIPIGSAARAALARTLYAMGKHVPAIIELKRAWRDRPATVEELLLAGQAFLAQRLHAEAEEMIREALAIEGKNVAALADLGGVLYLQNRFAELDALLQGISPEATRGSAFLSNLEGHLLAWKGLHAEAGEAYLRAASLAGTQGLFFLHAGNEFGAAGFDSKAVDAWLEAARAFLAANELDDLGDAVERLLERAGTDARAVSIAGKYRYAIGDERAATRLLEDAIALGTDDSAVWYLSGMMLSARDKGKKAIERFRKAVELEGEYGLYRFRLAEALFGAGAECAAEIERAIETDPDNGWAWNLAALKALADGDLGEAERCAIRAASLLPNELDPIVNRAEILRKRGRLDEGLTLFTGDDAESLHARANLLVADGRYEEADELYVRAIRVLPFDAELLTDRAANCLELDLLNEADDLLRRAIEIAPSPRVYRLIAFLSGRKGEYLRAEVALQRGIEEFPDATELIYELASVYQATGKTDKAQKAAERLLELDDSSRSRELAEEITDSATFRIDCSSCGRHWRVPKDIPPQGSLRLTAEPPDELPAGTCPACQVNYCIGCAKERLGDDGRFRCTRCGEPLKLVNQGIIWILSQWQEKEAARDQ